MTCGIYLIVNTVSRMYYVGQSSNIEHRFYSHRSILRRSPSGCRVNAALKNSWAKHGEAAFAFVILEACAVGQLTLREDYWLREIRDVHGLPVANFAGPCDNPMRGTRHTPETLKKLSEAQAGKPKSEEHRRRIGAAHKGREKSPEERANISAGRKGIKVPLMMGDNNPSRRPELRLSMTGDGNPTKQPEVRARMVDKCTRRRCVVDVSSGEAWPSLTACAVALGVSIAAVHAAVTKKNPTVAGRVIA